MCISEVRMDCYIRVGVSHCDSVQGATAPAHTAPPFIKLPVQVSGAPLSDLAKAFSVYKSPTSSFISLP